MTIKNLMDDPVILISYLLDRFVRKVLKHKVSAATFTVVDIRNTCANLVRVHKFRIQ